MTTTKWTIDPAHSRITFRVKHMMITNVNGEFKNFSGTVDFDPSNPTNTSVDLQIATESIDTNAADRDNHLRSADFLNVETHPEITFNSTNVEMTGEETASLHGNLSISGKSKPVSMDVVLNGIAQSPWGQTVAGFSSSVNINREDWGLTWNKALETGGFLVGKDIQIGIELELIKEAEAELAVV